MVYRHSRAAGADHVRINYSGPLGDADFAESLRLSRDHFDPDRGMPRLLCDLRRADGQLSAVATYEWVHAKRHLVWQLGWRIALLVRDGDHSFDFFETEAVNAGLAARVHTDEVEARRWLSGNVDGHAAPQPGTGAGHDDDVLAEEDAAQGRVPAIGLEGP